MKHIALREQFLRDLVTSRQVEPIYIRSNDNLADIFTKSLSKEKFCDLRIRICCVLRVSFAPDSVEGGELEQLELPISSINRSFATVPKDDLSICTYILYTITHFSFVLTSVLRSCSVWL